jgi:ribonuclease Z
VRRRRIRNENQELGIKNQERPRGDTLMSRLQSFCVVVAIVLCTGGRANAQELTVTLLGTGGPEPVLARFGPATLVEAGPDKLLFDAGRGVTQRLWQIETRLGDLTAVFLTHLHSDHVVGLPDLWLSGFQSTSFGGRTRPLDVWGPAGTSEMVLSLTRAFKVDVQNRAEGSGLSKEAVALMGHDTVEGMVYDRHGVTVTAFAVDHGNATIPAFGYRINYAGRSVVISGDTRPSDNLVRYAQGADVLVHEVMAVRPGALRESESARRVMSSHTSPEDVGAIFARVKPKLGVLTHVGVIAGPAARESAAAEIVPRVRSAYTGPLEMGEDLMKLVIGERVEVHKSAAR